MKLVLVAETFDGLVRRLYAALQGKRRRVVFVHWRDDAGLIARCRAETPDRLILAPVRRPLPAELRDTLTCLALHPAPPGVTGGTAAMRGLERAILDGVSTWGVRLVRPEDEANDGPVIAEQALVLRTASKGSLLRDDIGVAGAACLRIALTDTLPAAGNIPCPAPPIPLRDAERVIDWAHDDTATVLRKAHAADMEPGIDDLIDDARVALFDVHAEDRLSGPPGALLGWRDSALCRATVDGAVWIGHVRAARGPTRLKLPASHYFRHLCDRLPCLPLPPDAPVSGRTYRELRYEERRGVGYLHFPYYNGAMSTAQCRALSAAIAAARTRPIRVIALMGGRDFWCTGPDLNIIEAAERPAEESQAAIEALLALQQQILAVDRQFTLAALQGDAAGAGVFLAQDTDYVFARQGVVLAPLHHILAPIQGGHAHDAILTGRIAPDDLDRLADAPGPISAHEAQDIGLVDGCFGRTAPAFLRAVRDRAERLAQRADFDRVIAAKRAERRAAPRPDPEVILRRLQGQIFGLNAGYHLARHRFVFDEGMIATAPKAAVLRKG